MSDRVLLELVNGIGVASSVTADRSGMGVMGRLIANVTGQDHEAQILTFRHLINGQQALVQLSVEANLRSGVTDLALARVSTHLKSVKEVTLAVRDEHDELAGMVGELIQECDARDEYLSRVGQRLSIVELRMAADDFLEIAVTDAERVLDGVPWPYQVILLARQLASGPCGQWDAKQGDTGYRTRIANAVADAIDEVRQAPRHGVQLEGIIDTSWRVLSRTDERRLLAELLDVGLNPQLALAHGPLTQMAALTMELASLPDDSRPDRPAKVALELSRRRVGHLDGGATTRRFVDLAVREQFATVADLWRRR
ncbi:hypothetical protein G9272_33755 [Streptomyces asoensis]|uniref:Uncharacterized protein n=1 Tax=Streptomyces asoensis TaxID=249586 RepID=A0A6M4WVV8_9ACTN|nr:hypothetical protein [Streptomyces asoensis]QJT04657.1 hypothetical protein G9272_33755 [Streptomyces asoensis]